MRTFKRLHRTGFTLVELLVVIAIIGLLLAMLVPAVRTSGGAARRATCMNNIRQLILGIHNYESAHNHFPPATGLHFSDENKTVPATTDEYSGFLSFFQFTARYSGPYYDEAVEHEGVNYPAYPDVDAAGHPLWTLQWYGLTCPSLSTDDSGNGMIHYAFSIGDIARNIHAPNGIRGAFAVGKTQTFDDISDGSSMTIGLAEIGGNPSSRSVGHRFAINQPLAFLDDPSLAMEIVEDNSRKYRPDIALSPKFRGGNWADGTGGPGLVTTILPPGGPTLLVGGKEECDGFFSASVNHPRVTIVALMDGSGHTISSDIDVGDLTKPAQSAEMIDGFESAYGVWGALGSASGNEDVEFP